MSSPKDQPESPVLQDSVPPTVAAAASTPSPEQNSVDNCEVAAPASAAVEESGEPVPCGHCGLPVMGGKGPMTRNGPLHAGCILEYRFLHQPRCHYCDIRFLDSEATEFAKDEKTGYLYHKDCIALEQLGVPFARPTMESFVRKFSIARSKLSMKNWKTRYFVLSPETSSIRYFTVNPRTGACDAEKGDSKKENEREKEAEQKASVEEKIDSVAGDGDNNNNNIDDADEAGGEDVNDVDVGNESSKSSDESPSEAQPAAEWDHEKAAKALKGEVPLDKRSRLITRPSASVYKCSSSSASDYYDIAIVFYETPESTTARRLIFQCNNGKEYFNWVRALEAYIHTVDDPADYNSKKPKSQKRK